MRNTLTFKQELKESSQNLNEITEVIEEMAQKTE